MPKKTEEVASNWDDAALLGLREQPEGEEPKGDVSLDEIEEIEAQLAELKAKKEASLPRCGHVNAHSRGLDGKPDNLACTLPVGHRGNHKAAHTERVWGNPDGETEERMTEWNDAAGADWPKYVPPPPDWKDGQHQEVVDGKPEDMIWGNNL